VNKYYPAIFYPPLILKFLVKNPATSFKGYYLQSSSKLVKSPINRVFFSHILFTKFFYLIIITFFILISSSIILLSPTWLVTVVWLSISLGIFCFSSSFSQNLSNKNTSNSQQFQIKTGSQNVMRSRQPQKSFVSQQRQRQAKLYCWLQGKTLKSSGKSEATAGVSEKAFYQVMKHIFPSIVQGVAFQNPKFSHPYSADFILVHSSGLSIDIEIDEPYVGNTKAPHHCIDQGKDDIRNQFFTNNNWLVIRFSEKQVVKYPYHCCKVIAEVIARVAGDYTFLTQLKNVPNLPHEPMWTIKQAKNWAMLDYRKTYLP
jgi:very-short-patch-repair endonuclease